MRLAMMKRPTRFTIAAPVIHRMRWDDQEPKIALNTTAFRIAPWPASVFLA